MEIDAICRAARNWFDRAGDGKALPRLHGRFEVKGGEIKLPEGFVKDGQWFRVIGSISNDGAHRFPATDMVDEVFEGHVHLMAVPREVEQLAEDVASWRTAHEEASVSPFKSESFGGYTYQLRDEGAGWQAAFSDRLLPWRKL